MVGPAPIIFNFSLQHLSVFPVTVSLWPRAGTVGGPLRGHCTSVCMSGPFQGRGDVREWWKCAMGEGGVVCVIVVVQCLGSWHLLNAAEARRQQKRGPLH